MKDLKYLRVVKITSIGIAFVTLIFNLYRNLNNINNSYGDIIFWISIFTYFGSNMWINIEIKKRNKLKK
ncbi:hypothetical protein QJR26_19095 (plasmid) [Clostridium baratii]